MTGPQHYREAEQLLAQAAEAEVGSDIERYALAAAQVHATLALADLRHGKPRGVDDA